MAFRVEFSSIDSRATFYSFRIALASFFIFFSVHTDRKNETGNDDKSTALEAGLPRFAVWMIFLIT